MGVDHRDVLGIGGEDIDGGGVEGVADSLVRGRAFITFTDFGQHLG